MSDVTVRRLGAVLAYAETARLPDVYSYKTARKQATPSWACMASVRRMYQTAAAFGMHVDHVIPLRGRNVCGLHVPENLRLVTPAENMAKGNNLRT